MFFCLFGWLFFFLYFYKYIRGFDYLGKIVFFNGYFLFEIKDKKILIYDLKCFNDIEIELF